MFLKCKGWGGDTLNLFLWNVACSSLWGGIFRSLNRLSMRMLGGTGGSCSAKYRNGVFVASMSENIAARRS